MFRYQSDGKINDVRGYGCRPLHATLADQYWRKEANTASSYTDIGSQISDQSLKSQSWLRREKIRHASGFPTKKIDYGFLRRILGVSMKGKAKNGQEKFASSELREAVLKLRAQVKNLKIQIKDKNWLQSLRDLGDIDSLDEEFLRSLYLLRNCHQRNFFAKEPISDGVGTQKTLPTDETASDSSSIPSSDDMASSFTDSFRVSTVSKTSTNYSKTLSVGSSVMVGSGSPAVIKRRPHRPQFFLSLDNFRDNDDILPDVARFNLDPRRKGSDSSDGCRSYERANSLDSDTSYLNVTEEHSVSSRSNSLEKPTIIGEKDLNKNMSGNDDDEISHLCKACFKLNRQRLKPGSPTSELLSPIFDAKCCSDLQTAIDGIYEPISTSISRLQNFEQELKLLPVLQVKLAVLQEEKRQLMNMLKHQRTHKPLCSSLSDGSSSVHSGRSSPIFCLGSDGDSIKLGNSASPTLDGQVIHPDISPMFDKEQQVTDSGIASDLSERVCIDMGTQMINLTESNSQQTDRLSLYDVSTETEKITMSHRGVGNSIAEVFPRDKCIQETPLMKDGGIQTVAVHSSDSSCMQGPPMCAFQSLGVQVRPKMRDHGAGNAVAEIFVEEKETQCFKETHDKEVSMVPILRDASGSVGCSIFDLVDSCTGNHVDFADFSCGETVAELLSLDKQVQACVKLMSQSTLTDSEPLVDATTECNILQCRETRTVGVGSDTICDMDVKPRSRTVAVGHYNTNGPNIQYCAVDDKLCNCTKPKSRSVGVGPNSVYDIVCDRCQNKKTRTVGIGRDKVDDLLCDRCLYVRLRSVAVGDDKVDDPLCTRCKRKGKCLSIGVGDELIAPAGVLTDAEVQTEATSSNNNVPLNEQKFSTSSEEELCREISDILAHDTREKCLICNYCGNRMVPMDGTNHTHNLHVTEIDERKVSQGSLTSEFEKLAPNGDVPQDSRGGDQPVSPDEDDEEEEVQIKKKGDIIEICKLLQEHFSGRKHLKQQQMVVFMASIETIWFKTIKRKRAKPAVVKGYIDLFVTRIPELLQTIVNLADPDGNTSMHYALTYRNYSVVNILLDTGVCSIDVVNKAGYTPIMLAALVGFDHKKDKYVIQRLLSMGDLNSKSIETGQTALMLAVTRGNTSMVDLLMEAGADVNEVDDDGSTALMCACEIGNINIVKLLLSSPDCDATKEDNDGSTALSIAMDSRRKDLALLIYGSMNFDARGRIKLSPSKQSLLGLGSRRSPSPVIGRT